LKFTLIIEVVGNTSRLFVDTSYRLP